MISFFKYAEERDVQRLGTVFCKDDTFVTVTLEQIGEQIAAGEHPLGKRDRKSVSAPSGIGARFQRGVDGVLYGSGFVSARCGVIEINHINSKRKRLFYYTKAGIRS